MTTIEIQTNSFSEAQELLSKVYSADNSASYSDGKRAVNGSSLSGKIEWENIVVISSGYYTESSLREMFEN